MPISSFPPELLSAIFSHLHYNKYSLLQLSLTSKTFHRVAKPILYSTVTITFEETVDLVAQFKEDEAKLVRTLVLEGQDPEWDLLDEDALVGRFGTIPFDQWVSDLQGGLVQEIVQGDFLDSNRTFSSECSTPLSALKCYKLTLLVTECRTSLSLHSRHHRRSSRNLLNPLRQPERL